MIESLVGSGSKIRATPNPTAIWEADIILFYVPTMVTKVKDPDLGPGKSAAWKVEQNMKKGGCRPGVHSIPGSYRGGCRFYP